MGLGAKMAMVGGESESLGEFYATTGTISVSTSEAHGESQASYRSNPTAGNTGYGEVRGRDEPSMLGIQSVPWLRLELEDCHIGFWFKVKTLPASARLGMVLYFADHGGSQAGSIVMNYTGGIVLRNYADNTVASFEVLSTDTWYWIGVRAKTDSDEYEVYVNGTKYSGTCDWGGSAIRDIYVGHSFGSSLYNTAVDFYYDSIVLDSSWHLQADVVRLLPNADGTYDTWTAEVGTDTHEDVDEAPHDTDTTRAKNPGGGLAPWTVNLEPASTRNVSDDIFMVMPFVEARKLSLPESIQVRLRSNGSDYDAATFSLTTSYANYAKIYKVDPDDDGAWTTSKIDALEIGVDWVAGIQAANLLFVTQCLLMVAFIPSPPEHGTVHVKGGKILGGKLAA